MKTVITLALCLLLCAGCNQTKREQSNIDQPTQDRPYKDFHDSLIVVDGHNDVLLKVIRGNDISQRLTKGHTDIPRLIEGGVDVQVFAVWSDDNKWSKGAFKHANNQIDTLENILKKNPDKIALAKNTADVERIVADGKIAAIIGIESGNMIENSIDNLVALYDRGVRYLTLTWNYNLPWVTAAEQEVKTTSTEGKGLTDKGRDIVRKMNELGMMIDVSHVGEKAFYDVLEVTTKPILASHSNAYTLAPHYRNLKDEQLAALKENGGVVGVNFFSEFLDSNYKDKVARMYRQHAGDEADPKLSTSRQYAQLPDELQKEVDVPMSVLLDHIDYLVDKLGIDHVAVGSDFDGISSSPTGLEDVSKFPNLTQALLEREYSKEDVAKIMGQNFLRIMKENEK